MTMIIRVRGPDGMVRLTLEPTSTFGDLGQQLISQIPPTVNPTSIELSNKPNGSDSKNITQINQFQIQQVGLKHGDCIFITYNYKGDEPEPESPAREAGPITARLNGKAVVDEGPSDLGQIAQITEGAPRPWEFIKQSVLDNALDKKPGIIQRSRNSMCRHGPKGMCDYCTPLEPYDPKYLADNGIKYPSFHAHLRKINAATNKPESGTSFIPPLTEPFYRVAENCSGGHPAWPVGICSKCQPSAIILQPQSFRMVDHVEFSEFSIVNRFIDAWRQTGTQRFGYLIGRYAEYTKVPLGIKAVVEAIYEPPQKDESDGLTLSEFEQEDIVRNTARACGLEIIGVIWSDLMDTGKGDGSVVCKRHVDSYFLSSQEICFASRMQAKYPRVTKWSRTGTFGSNFVTCIISGNESSQIEISSYQMSNSAVEMIRANIIEPSADPAVMLVQEEEDETKGPRTRYIPEVFYRKINEYGANVQENAKPAFPVEYLFVTLTHGFPDVSQPMFKAAEFPIENREYIGSSQEPSALSRLLSLKSGTSKPSGLSDFHVLCYITSLEALNKDELLLLSAYATNPTPATLSPLVKCPGWQTLVVLIQQSGERNLKRPRTLSNPVILNAAVTSEFSNLEERSMTEDGQWQMGGDGEEGARTRPHDDVPLAKRFAAVRLENENQPRRG